MPLLTRTSKVSNEWMISPHDWMFSSFFWGGHSTSLFPCLSSSLGIIRQSPLLALRWDQANIPGPSPEAGAKEEVNVWLWEEERRKARREKKERKEQIQTWYSYKYNQGTLGTYYESNHTGKTYYYTLASSVVFIFWRKCIICVFGLAPSICALCPCPRLPLELCG